MQSQSKSLVGRPSKIGPFVEMMRLVFDSLKNDKEILNTGSTFIYTDYELFDMINLALDEKDQIHLSTFEKWKAKAKKNKKVNDPIFNEFVRLVKKALIVQKREIMARLHQEPDKWQKYAWIMERKFGDWNIRQIDEEKGEKDPVVFAPIKIILPELPDQKTNETS